MLDKSLDKIIKKHLILTALTGVAVVLLMITVTYGLYQVNHENTSDQEISLGDFDVDLTSSSGQITLSNLNPGVENETTYTFTTSNSGDYIVKYNVYFTDNTTTFLADGANAGNYSSYTQITSDNYKYIEYKLDSGQYRPLSNIYNSSDGRFTIITGKLQPNDSYNHTVKFRVSGSAPNDIQGSILALNITMEGAATDETAVDTIMKLVSGSPTNTIDIITKPAPAGATCTNTLAYDGTSENNLRYVGADPCNYVTFNNETAGWRIVGVMSNVDDGTGNKESRLKLVRSTSLGDYSWDSSASSVNSGWGVNDWTQADLKNELNGDYLNASLTSNTLWYNGQSNQKTAEYDYTKSIKDDAQNLIINTKWLLGGALDALSENSKAADFYEYERGTTVWGSNGETCGDSSCPRKLFWTGKVALLYPSDYALAVGGSSRSECLSYNLREYGTYVTQNNWIHNAHNMFLLSPSTYLPYRAFITYGEGFVGIHHTGEDFAIYPALYLKSSVKITGGNGSAESPYTLG